MKSGALIIASFVMGASAMLALATLNEGTATVRSSRTKAAVGVAVTEPSRTAQLALTTNDQSIDEHDPARIAIPRLHLATQIGTNLDDGPIWWPVTGRPGGGDTIAIAGHRTTHTHPFLDLDRLVTGNRIYLRWQGLSYRYVVSGRRIISSKNQHIADARGYEMLLLTACTPKGSARQRIVIYARPDVVPSAS